MSKKEYIVLFVFIVLVFVFNAGHIAQQDVFTDYYIPLADSILNKFQYGINNKPMTYPMWGYSAFMLIAKLLGSYYNIIIIQFVLCYFSILVFYKSFNIKYKNIHLPLLLPYIALCSVKWNDAIVASSLVFYVYFLAKSIKDNNLKSNIISGLILGVILNLRSEYLGLLLFQFIGIVLIKSVRQSVKLKIHSVIYLTAILTLFPWAIRNYIEFGEMKFSSTNGASVMYISLGQLADNVWGIKAVDNTAFQVVKKHRIADPYSLEGEKVLKEEFIEKVKSEPMEYVKKCASNALSFFIGGVYTGEYGSVLIKKDMRQSIDNKINKAEGFDKFNVILSQDFYASYPILIEKVILIIYRVIWLALIVIFFYNLFKMKWDMVILMGIILFTFKLITIAAIQYEYRHINPIYIFVLGTTLKAGLTGIKSKKV